MAKARYSNRSQAIQTAVRKIRRRRKRSHLAAEVVKLDPEEERGLADEAFAGGDGKRLAIVTYG